MPACEIWGICACLGAGLFGFLACRLALGTASLARWRKVLKADAAVVADDAGRVYSGGLSAWLIGLAIRQSIAVSSPPFPGEMRFGGSGDDPSFLAKVALAGLRGRITLQGACRAGAIACGFAAAFGFLFGAMASLQLAVVFGLSGALAGLRGVSWALAREAQARKHLMEGCLSEALEVLCLGLRSGLSFDYALRLYCRHFPGVLSADLGCALGEWSSGLKGREEALRDVSATYDSAVLRRVVESVVRSMRFGSPLAADLEALAEEVRRTHKAQVQEKVMKAPVKMMLPVGTLILPSMLILVLGPVLLDLSNGF